MSVVTDPNDLEEVLECQARMLLAMRDWSALVLFLGPELAGRVLVDAATTINALTSDLYEILEQRMEAWETGEASDVESGGESDVSDMESNSDGSDGVDEDEDFIAEDEEADEEFDTQKRKPKRATVLRATHSQLY